MGLELDKLVGHLQVNLSFEVSRGLSAELGELGCKGTEVNHRGMGSEAGTGSRRRNGEHTSWARTEVCGKAGGDKEGSGTSFDLLRWQSCTWG